MLCNTHGWHWSGPADLCDCNLNNCCETCSDVICMSVREIPIIMFNAAVFNWGCVISGCRFEALKCTETYMGLKTFIAPDAQTIPNFLIIRTKRWSIIHRLPADVRTVEMRCNIEESHTIFCRHVDHKCWYEAKTKPALTTTGIIGSTFPVVTAT